MSSPALIRQAQREGNRHLAVSHTQEFLLHIYDEIRSLRNRVTSGDRIRHYDAVTLKGYATANVPVNTEIILTTKQHHPWYIMDIEGLTADFGLNAPLLINAERMNAATIVATTIDGTSDANVFVHPTYIWKEEAPATSIVTYLTRFNKDNELGFAASKAITTDITLNFWRL